MWPHGHVSLFSYFAFLSVKTAERNILQGWNILNYSLSYNCSSNSSSFWLTIKQHRKLNKFLFWVMAAILNRGRICPTILKGGHPRTTPAKVSITWLSGFRIDLNVKAYDVWLMD